MGPSGGMALIGYDTPPHIEAYRSEFLQQVHIPATRTMIDYLAECQVWTGAMRNGHGVVRTNSREIPVQAYAFELYYGPIPERDLFSNKLHKVPMVARCVAALTKDCVHREHLGLNPARSSHRWFRKLTLAERQKIRYVALDESLEGTLVPKLDGRWKLPLARIARIATFREGENDPPWPVDKVG